MFKRSLFLVCFFYHVLNKWKWMIQYIWDGELKIFIIVFNKIRFRWSTYNSKNPFLVLAGYSLALAVHNPPLALHSHSWELLAVHRWMVVLGDHSPLLVLAAHKPVLGRHILLGECILDFDLVHSKSYRRNQLPFVLSLFLPILLLGEGKESNTIYVQKV